MKALHNGQEADLDGEGVAKEVCEASDGREHGALHELPCPRESLAQVLVNVVIIIHTPPLFGWTDGDPTRRVSSSKRGDGGWKGGFWERRGGQLAAEGGVGRRWREVGAGMEAKHSPFLTGV